MKKQIGGYFELALPDAQPALFVHADGALLNSGRNALEYILQHIDDDVDLIWVPSFSCDTVLEPLEKMHLNYRFYHVDENLHVPNIELREKDYLIYNNYFGIMDGYICTLFDKYGGQLIIDNTQSFQTQYIPNSKAFYSPRKCFGVSDGGIAYPNMGTEQYEQDYSHKRFTHLLKRCELPAIEGYQAFKENGKTLRGQPIRKMSILTQRILNTIDFSKAAMIRRRNFQHLHTQLRASNGMKKLMDSMCVESVPSFYPYLVDNAAELRQKLIDNEVFVAIYWPNVLDAYKIEKWECGSDIEQKIVSNAIPLPIDQRYGEEDMQRIIEIVCKTQK